MTPQRSNFVLTTHIPYSETDVSILDRLDVETYTIFVITTNVISRQQDGKRKNLINLPIVGIVVTISPNFNLYKIVVLPAASNPTKTNRTNRY